MAVFNGRIRSLAQASMLALCVLTVGVTLAGCDLTENTLKIDREGNAEMQDYRDALSARSAAMAGTEAKEDTGIPALQPYVAQPSSKLKAMPLVSISVNQTVPVRDALFELAQQANYDIELDPRITGSIIFTAHDKPFDEVVDRISEIAGLRYKFADNSVRIELDTPYQKVYKIDYLSYIRKNKSSVDNNIAVVSNNNVNSGSAYEVTGESESDFWGELSSSLQQIIGVAETVSSLKTSTDPNITAVAKNPAPVAQVNGGGAATAGGDNNAKPATPPPSTTPPQAVLQVQSLPTDPNAANAGAKKDDAEKPSFSLNKQAGIITVFASEREHKKIEAYLEELRRSVTAQVLIEAKVLEVGLNDEFSAGINWSQIIINSKLATSFTTTTALGRAVLDPVPAPPTNFQLGYSGGDFNALIDAVSRYGTVRALSSPRLTVLNNQSAVLNVANNVVYFTLKFTTTQSQTTSQTDATSEVHSVPEGVLINVQPSINLTDRTISMAVRPTITRIIGYVNDPAVAIEAPTATAVSAVPEVNVQEMDSVINLQSGQAVVMGGLMQDRATSSQQGVPVLSEIPYLGAMFRNQSDSNKKTELIIFLKATILDNGNNFTQTDKDLYKQFGNDRRPLDL
jgi:general secretion pathway protein D